MIDMNKIEELAKERDEIVAKLNEICGYSLLEPLKEESREHFLEYMKDREYEREPDLSLTEDGLIDASWSKGDRSCSLIFNKKGDLAPMSVYVNRPAGWDACDPGFAM